MEDEASFAFCVGVYFRRVRLGDVFKLCGIGSVACRPLSYKHSVTEVCYASVGTVEADKSLVVRYVRLVSNLFRNILCAGAKKEYIESGVFSSGYEVL